MSQEDFSELVELFRTLKRWRDDKDRKDQEAFLRRATFVEVELAQAG